MPKLNEENAKHIGERAVARYIDIIKQNGDTTPAQMTNLAHDLAGAFLCIMEEEGLVQRVGKHFRLTAKGRE